LRSEQYDDLTLADLVVYIRSMKPRPNRWKLPGFEMTPAQERGLALFTRGVDKFGKPFPNSTAALIAIAAPRAPIRSCSMWEHVNPRQFGPAEVGAADRHCAYCALSS